MEESTKFGKGLSCHQCKSRRNFSALTNCANVVKKKRCRKKFCGLCLKKFYKENVRQIDKDSWSCPSCRKICCCAACRRRKQKDLGLPMEKPLSRADGILALAASLQNPYIAQLQAQLQAQLGQLQTMQHQADMLQQNLSKSSTPPLSPKIIPPSSKSLTPSHPVVDSTPTSPSAMDERTDSLLTVPVLKISTNDIPSPLGTPLSSPKRNDFELDEMETFGEDLPIVKERQRVSSSQLPNLLDRQLQTAAQKLRQGKPKNQQFELLYQVALQPRIKKKIQMLLFRTDLSKTQKIDCIASLLRNQR